MIESLNNYEMIIPILTIGFVIMLVAFIVAIIQLVKLNNKYRLFTSLSDEVNIEKVLISNQTEIKAINKREAETETSLNNIYSNLKKTYEKMGVVKYNAFDGLGGQLSAVTVLLNKNLDGSLTNSIHTRDSNHMYVKLIKAGKCDQALSSEEEEALKKAIRS